MTTAEQNMYNTGASRAQAFLQSEASYGVPKSLEIVTGYGIKWVRPSGEVRSAGLNTSHVADANWRAGFTSVITAAQNATGGTSGLPTSNASTTAPPETTGTVTTQIINDAVTTAGIGSLGGNWLKWLLIAVAGWWLWKRFKRR